MLDIWSAVEIALLVLAFELAILLPAGLVLGERWIKSRVPLLLDDMANDPDTVAAARDLIQKFVPAAGMFTGGKPPSLKQALSIGALMLAQRFFGGGQIIQDAGAAAAVVNQVGQLPPSPTATVPPPGALQ